MRKISIKKTFLYVCLLMLTLCTLCAFVLWDRPSKTISAEAATSFTSVHTSWSTNGSCTFENVESSDITSTIDPGLKFSGSGEYKLKSTRKAWPDKFGLAFNAVKSSGTFRVIVTPDADIWYEDEGASQSALIFEINSSGTVSLYIGTENLANSKGVGQWGSALNMSGSENRMYFGKKGTGWAFSNGATQPTVTGSSEVSTLNTAFAAFENRVGYVQIHNKSGALTFTYKSVLYGMPVGGNGLTAPDGYTDLINGAPAWTETVGDEVVGWMPQNNSRYTITTFDKTDNSDSPKTIFRNMEIDIRMAPGDTTVSTDENRIITRNMIAFFSGYKHDWYAGSYSVAFGFKYNSDVHGDDKVELELHVFDEGTDSKGERSCRFSQEIAFKWYETNKFAFVIEEGMWAVQVNGITVWRGDDVDEKTGKTINDYFNDVYAHCANNEAYLQVWGYINGDNSTFKNEDNAPVPDDGFVVEKITKWEEPTYSTISVGYNKEFFDELEAYEQFYKDATYTLNVEDLFTATNESTNSAYAGELYYWSSSGEIDENGNWYFTARSTDEERVTFLCTTETGETAAYDVNLHFIESESASAASLTPVSIVFGDNEISLMTADGIVLPSVGGDNTSPTLPTWAIVLISVGGALAAGAAVTAAIVISKKRRGE